MRSWSRRKENDKHASRLSAGLSSANLSLELASDPAGIGFGFGGVEPGTLHARGELYEKHAVYYSIGLAGEYLLHVRLRHAAAAIPGSPFKLEVSARCFWMASDGFGWFLMALDGVQCPEGCCKLLSARAVL